MPLHPPRRTPWQPSRGGNLYAGDAIEKIGGQAQDAWPSAPDVGDSERLDRLLEKIPPGLAVPIRLCTLQGQSQRVAGAFLGVGQVCISYRLQAARKRLLLASKLTVDLTPSEVLTRLLQARVAPSTAWLVSSYAWHQTTGGAALAAALATGTKRQCQGGVWYMLFQGAWRRKPELIEVAALIDEIRLWPVHNGQVGPRKKRSGNLQ